MGSPFSLSWRQDGVGAIPAGPGLGHMMGCERGPLPLTEGR